MDFAEFFDRTTPGLVRLCYLATLDRDAAADAAQEALPVRQREAIVLHYWADLGVDACAAAMGVSPGSVKQHLSRARQRLAGDFGPHALDLEADIP